MLHRSKDINCIAMLQSQNIKGDIYIKDSHEWKSKNKYVIEHDKKATVIYFLCTQTIYA